MAAWAPCVLVFGFLSATAQILTTQKSEVPKIDIQVTVSSENPESISLNCTVEPGLSGMIRIEVGKVGYREYYPYNVDEAIGRIDAYKGIITHANVIVDGHFDPTGSTLSYLSATRLTHQCADDGRYYCIVLDTKTGSRTGSRTTTNLTICNNITELTQVTPDVTNPTNTVITCQLRTNQKVTSISFIGIFWARSWFKKSWISLVSANSSSNDGLASTGPAFTENMKISGNINQSYPHKSQLVVKFPSETCQDSAQGQFACVIRYSDSDWASTHLARAELAALAPCSRDYPGIKISQRNENDPTWFSVNCQESLPPSLKLINLEISLIPDTPSSVPSGRRHVAYYNRFSPAAKPTVNPDLAEKGVSVSVSRFLNVFFSAGTCEDTGVFRCKGVYQPTDKGAMTVLLSEARLPACLQGAVVTVERSYPADGPWTETLVCRVDSLRVVELVSLEVSVVRNGTRRVLADINSFLNDAKVRHESSDVRVEGEIYPYNPAASSLNVTSALTSLEGVSLYITTCTAVYYGNETNGIVVESLADARVRFQK